MRKLTLEPGLHAFYGAAKLTLHEGSVVFRGARLPLGFTGEFVFPFHALPGTMSVETKAEITLEEIPKTHFAECELGYLTGPKTPANFEQIFETLFYKSTGVEPDYPAPLIDKINEIIEGEPSKILVSGRGGKSTFCRFLVNAIISRHGHCFFVDIDPGQPDRTLPELISMRRLDSFVLGTPEHLTRVDREKLQIYTGEVTITKIQSYQALLKLADACPEGEFIVINSHGWCDGLGKDIQKDVVTLFQPSHVLVMYMEGTEPPDIVSDQFNACLTGKPPAREISKRDHRELRIITYFLRGQLPPVAQQPISFRLSAVRFGLAFDGYFDFSQVPALISGSLVYLCHDDRQYKPIRKQLTIVKTLCPMQCVGVGIVKAIDVENDVVYIATPDQPTNVNLIVVSSQTVPAILFAGNPRCQVTYMTSPLQHK